MISLVRKMPEANEAVRQEFRSGRATLEPKLAACSGSLPMAPPDRAEVLAMLISDSYQRISEKSQNALLSVPHAAFIIALGRADASPTLVAYCSRNLAEKSDIADLVAVDPFCSAEDLSRVARALSVTGLQALFDNLERLADHPKFVTALLLGVCAPESRSETTARGTWPGRSLRARAGRCGCRCRARSAQTTVTTAAAGDDESAGANAARDKRRPRETHGADSRPLPSGAARSTAIAKAFGTRSGIFRVDDELDGGNSPRDRPEKKFSKELYDRKKSCEQFEDADLRFAKSASDDSTHGLENAYSK